MQIITAPVVLKELWESREIDFKEMMKAVADLDKEILAIDADMHADLEQLLLEEGSEQQHLWGFNIYPEKTADQRLEFTSFINIRPSAGNRGMVVQDPEIREKIRLIVAKLLV